MEPSVGPDPINDYYRARSSIHMAGERDPLDPDEAFWLLSDETRVAILQAVWAAPETPISFSEIRDRVGRPDSGNFNYHIDKLRGHFLAQVEEGYELTQAGREVVRAVMAGTLTERPTTDPMDIDAECVDCDGPLVARFDDHGHIECAECGATVMWNEFPPAGRDGREPGELARAFDRWTQRRFRLAMDGVCPSCAARMETTRVGGPSDDEEAVASLHRCSNCRYEARVPLFGHVLEHPAVVSFYHEKGIDIVGMPYWEFQSMARDFIESLLDEDPWRAAIELEADGESLTLTLDETFEVVDVDRSAD